jgi:hypothetical protein
MTIRPWSVLLLLPVSASRSPSIAYLPLAYAKMRGNCRNVTEIVVPFPEAHFSLAVLRGYRIKSLIHHLQSCNSTSSIATFHHITIPLHLPAHNQQKRHLFLAPISVLLLLFVNEAVQKLLVTIHLCFWVLRFPQLLYSYSGMHLLLLALRF